MSERKIGGSYQCRICGDIHTFGILCDIEYLPLQKVQVAFEDMEVFFLNHPMSKKEREGIYELNKELKSLLSIPSEKIYGKKFLSGIEKKFEYNPSSDILIKAESILSRLFDFAMGNIYVTWEQDRIMTDILSALKKQVLKK